MSAGLALTNLALLLRAERNRIMLSKATMSNAGFEELRRIGKILQVDINPDAQINEVIAAFKAKLDKLQHEMAATNNPAKFFKSVAIAESHTINKNPASDKNRAIGENQAAPVVARVARL